MKDYDLFLKSIISMFGLSSSILLTLQNNPNPDLKKELKLCLNQIKEFLDETNETLMQYRGSNERIVFATNSK